MTFIVPEHIETQRLLLRQFKESDWQDLHRYYSSPTATEFTVGRAFSEGETWRTLCSMIGHWQLRGYGPYAIEERATGAVIGVSGFWYPNDWPEPEIKWALAPDYWGKGFASEAARAVQRVALQCFPDKPLISFIHGDNKASIQLALAVGAELEQEIEFRGAHWRIYRHPTEVNA